MKLFKILVGQPRPPSVVDIIFLHLVADTLENIEIKARVLMALYDLFVLPVRRLISDDLVVTCLTNLHIHANGLSESHLLQQLAKKRHFCRFFLPVCSLAAQLHTDVVRYETGVVSRTVVSFTEQTRDSRSLLVLPFAEAYPSFVVSGAVRNRLHGMTARLLSLKVFSIFH